MRVFVLLFACCCALWFPARAQTPQAYETAAGLSFDSKDYYAAMKYYEQVLQMQPERLDILERFAESARLFGALSTAERAYEQLLSGKGKDRFAAALLSMADVKKTLGKYDQAIPLLQQYRNLAGADPELKNKAAREIEICEWALEQSNNPDITVRIERLPENPNTGFSEFGAIQQGPLMLYSAFRDVKWGDKHYPQRPLLQIMQYENGAMPHPAPFFNSPDQHTANLNISADGQMAVFNHGRYAGETAVQCDLYFSRSEENGGWSEPQRLPDYVNLADFTATQAALMPAENGAYTVFFVSDRPGGKGGLDIWSISIDANGNCTQPKNFEWINTPADDITPYFSNFDHCLYFSSNGRPTLGGYDVYKIALQPDNSWSQPEHLPIPVNSSFNDIHYAPQGPDWAYFASNRIGSSNLEEDACCFDIYKSTTLPIRLETQAFSEMDGEALGKAHYTLYEAGSENTWRLVAESTQPDWEVRRNTEYMVIAAQTGYRPDSALVRTEVLPADRRFVKKLFLKPDIRLAVNAFNQLSEDPLSGVTIRLFEMSGHAEKEILPETAMNGSYPLDYLKQYKIIVEKNGYYPDTLLVSADELRQADAGASLSKHFFLTPASLSGYLPINLYFDNDQPKSSRQIQSYDQAYAEYHSRRQEFIASFTAGMNPEDSIAAAAQLERFFTDEVQGGYLKLEFFAENLELFLKNQYTVVIMVKGFASPLASEEYNLALTRRRIASVTSYFRKYGNGLYAPYLQNRQLQITSAPMGELEAGNTVSDNRNNRRLSVYSVEASQERRTEIIEVKLSKN